MPSPAEYAEQERFDKRMAERDELRAEIEQLRETIAEWQAIHGTFTGDVHTACQTEIEQLQTALAGHHIKGFGCTISTCRALGRHIDG
jgi:hypothetical protein